MTQIICFHYLRHSPLHFWNIYSIFFQLLLQIYSILKICYDILRYSAIPFLWRKISANLDFQRTFQYFQALYSVVRFSLKLFHTYFNDLTDPSTISIDDFSNTELISVVSTALYAIFYFFAVNVPVGKTLFTLLMISNAANLAVISSKCIEGYLFPELARQSYRWSFSFVFFLVEIILCVSLFFVIKKYINLR